MLPRCTFHPFNTVSFVVSTPHLVDMADSMQQVVRVYLQDAIMCERPPGWAKHAVDFFYVAPASHFLSTNPLRTGLADASNAASI